jgi:hypothetical protein
MSNNDKEKQNQKYLENLLGSNTQSDNASNDDMKKEISKIPDVTYTPPSSEYIFINVESLPAGRFYKKGTKIAIRAAKVAEIQAYSMVDDNNFVDVVEKCKGCR